MHSSTDSYHYYIHLSIIVLRNAPKRYRVIARKSPDRFIKQDVCSSKCLSIKFLIDFNI